MQQAHTQHVTPVDTHMAQTCMQTWMPRPTPMSAIMHAHPMSMHITRTSHLHVHMCTHDAA